MFSIGKRTLQIVNLTAFLVLMVCVFFAKEPIEKLIYFAAAVMQLYSAIIVWLPREVADKSHWVFFKPVALLEEIQRVEAEKKILVAQIKAINPSYDTTDIERMQVAFLRDVLEMEQELATHEDKLRIARKNWDTGRLPESQND